MLLHTQHACKPGTHPAAGLPGPLPTCAMDAAASACCSTAEKQSATVRWQWWVAGASALLAASGLCLKSFWTDLQAGGHGGAR
jgi:hypothetical protein